MGFLFIALTAGLLGFSGIAGASTSMAKMFLIIFLTLFVISLAFSKSDNT